MALLFLPLKVVSLQVVSLRPIYIKPLVEAENYGRIVAIDIETGEFELADEILPATDRLFERIPNAQP